MSRTLLVIDDALIIREIIKDAARAAGWTIAGEAIDGQQAIELYAALRPDVATLDLVMPHYDGLHGLRGILEVDPAARVLIVSALDQTSILKEAFQIGAADFIVKPFDHKHLVATLDRLVPASAPAAATDE